MTRLWIRNLTSRNDSRTGAALISRGAAGAGGAPPGGGASVPVPVPEGPAGAPGDAAGPEPGRALSIRLRRDIAYTPLWPWRAVITAMRRSIFPWPVPCARLPPPTDDAPPRRRWPDEERPGRPGPPDCSRRMGSPG